MSGGFRRNSSTSVGNSSVGGGSSGYPSPGAGAPSAISTSGTGVGGAPPKHLNALGKIKESLMPFSRNSAPSANNAGHESVSQHQQERMLLSRFGGGWEHGDPRREADPGLSTDSGGLSEDEMLGLLERRGFERDEALMGLRMTNFQSIEAAMKVISNNRLRSGHSFPNVNHGMMDHESNSSRSASPINPAIGGRKASPSVRLNPPSFLSQSPYQFNPAGDPHMDYHAAQLQMMQSSQGSSQSASQYMVVNVGGGMQTLTSVESNSMADHSFDSGPQTVNYSHSQQQEHRYFLETSASPPNVHGDNSMTSTKTATYLATSRKLDKVRPQPQIAFRPGVRETVPGLVQHANTSIPRGGDQIGLQQQQQYSPPQRAPTKIMSARFDPNSLTSVHLNVSPSLDTPEGGGRVMNYEMQANTTGGGKWSMQARGAASNAPIQISRQQDIADNSEGLHNGPPATGMPLLPDYTSYIRSSAAATGPQYVSSEQRQLFQSPVMGEYPVPNEPPNIYLSSVSEDSDLVVGGGVSGHAGNGPDRFVDYSPSSSDPSVQDLLEKAETLLGRSSRGGAIMGGPGNRPSPLSTPPHHLLSPGYSSAAASHHFPPSLPFKRLSTSSSEGGVSSVSASGLHNHPHHAFISGGPYTPGSQQMSAYPPASITGSSSGNSPNGGGNISPHHYSAHGRHQPQQQKGLPLTRTASGYSAKQGYAAGGGQFAGGGRISPTSSLSTESSLENNSAMNHRSSSSSSQHMAHLAGTPQNLRASPMMAPPGLSSPQRMLNNNGGVGGIPHSPSSGTGAHLNFHPSSSPVGNTSPFLVQQSVGSLAARLGSTAIKSGGEEGTEGEVVEVVRSVSPLPESVMERLEAGTYEPLVKQMTVKAFKFFMEQHVENVIKQHKEREKRMFQLNRELAHCNLTTQVQCGMRRLLMQKESLYLRLKRQKLNPSMFAHVKTIGQGAFGEVALVRKRGINALYAMKVLRKQEVIKKNQAAHVKAERDILSEADNEWVVKLYYSFQDKDNLYFIMDYIPGGDLMALLIKKGIFEEGLAKFYIAELVCAIESVHKLKFIHRDIKPDNILIDKNGHIKLTDFGLCTGFRWTHESKHYRNPNAPSHEVQDSFDALSSEDKLLDYRHAKQKTRIQAHSLVGTPNYIAPEVLERTGHTQLCDWWSVGVILFEMLVGCPPFQADSPAETQMKIINWRRTLSIPPNRPMSNHARRLIMQLCCDTANRLGRKNGAEDIKNNPWFEGIPWKNLRQTVAPYRPEILHDTDTSNFDPVPSRSDVGSSSDVDSLPEHAFYEFTFRRFFEPDGRGCPTLRLPSTGGSGLPTAAGIGYESLISASERMMSGGKKSRALALSGGGVGDFTFQSIDGKQPGGSNSSSATHKSRVSKKLLKDRHKSANNIDSSLTPVDASTTTSPSEKSSSGGDGGSSVSRLSANFRPKMRSRSSGKAAGFSRKQRLQPRTASSSKRMSGSRSALSRVSEVLSSSVVIFGRQSVISCIWI